MGMGVAEFSIAIGKICIFPIFCVYLRSIQYPNFLLSNDLDLLLQDSDSFYLPLQRKYTPKLRKSKIDISYS